MTEQTATKKTEKEIQFIEVDVNGVKTIVIASTPAQAKNAALAESFKALRKSVGARKLGFNEVFKLGLTPENTPDVRGHKDTAAE